MRSLRYLPIVLAFWAQRAEVFSSERIDIGPQVRQFVSRYCVDCHAGSEPAAALNLSNDEIYSLAANAGDQKETASQHHLESANSGLWERVVRKLSSRQMPPVDSLRPGQQEYVITLKTLCRSLDNLANKLPKPGRTDSLRRMTRIEYQNAIRDLLNLEIDTTTLLPPDESSHGFDNITVGDLSPTLLSRYITAAQKISRLALGASISSPAGDTIRLRPDLTQEEHVPGLPLGTRGGALVHYTFPKSGEYEIQLRLTRDRNENVEGLRSTHQLELLLDRQRTELFTIKPPQDEDHSRIDAHLTKRIHVAAGPHDVGVTFLKMPSLLQETMRQPLDAHFNMHRHPRLSPAIFQISITGPFSTSLDSETPSRQRILIARPASPDDEPRCAQQILSNLTKRAFRRPATDDDLAKPLTFYNSTRASGGGFEAGIEAALSAILVSPHFIFRFESDPADSKPGQAYRISDLELASRLSYFLWSSIPDDELLELAIQGQLSRPDVLRQQAERMLTDRRSAALVTNFADQWLYLRNLNSMTPDMRLFPDFDDNLRQAFRRETELFFESIVREDRSVLDLLRSNYTFLNERLAKHYDIPHVYGSRFRRVHLDPGVPRGGLLRHGSILAVTSYATRTSPVIRGHWLLKNFVGAPPPPPPDDVPALDDNRVSATLPIRQRLSKHRANPACASCHNLMDPIGFALENFDAIGRWREVEHGETVDSQGSLPDGSQFRGVAGLEDALLKQPEWFVGTLSEKLLTYALGRGVETFDGPAIRKIVGDSANNNYRFSALVTGIVTSTPFQMRQTK